MATKKDSRPTPRQPAQWRAQPKPVDPTGAWSNPLCYHREPMLGAVPSKSSSLPVLSWGHSVMCQCVECRSMVLSHDGTNHARGR